MYIPYPSPFHFTRTHTYTHTTQLQISFDVAWSPNCIDGRCYQYAELALVTDYLVVMSYDERSQIYGPCVAGANSGYNTTATGILQYRTLGLNTTQLILGVPWYGYNYPCLSLSEDHVCSIEKVPFRGADCSDAAGQFVDSRVEYMYMYVYYDDWPSYLCLKDAYYMYHLCYSVIEFLVGI